MARIRAGREHVGARGMGYFHVNWVLWARYGVPYQWSNSPLFTTISWIVIGCRATPFPFVRWQKAFPEFSKYGQGTKGQASIRMQSTIFKFILSLFAGQSPVPWYYPGVRAPHVPADVPRPFRGVLEAWKQLAFDRCYASLVRIWMPWLRLLIDWSKVTMTIPIQVKYFLYLGSIWMHWVRLLIERSKNPMTIWIQPECRKNSEVPTRLFFVNSMLCYSAAGYMLAAILVKWIPASSSAFCLFCENCSVAPVELCVISMHTALILPYYFSILTLSNNTATFL